MVPLRLRRSKDVLRPSSGSSVPARRVLNKSDDLLPDCSSGSSVPARRVLPRRSDDLRPVSVAADVVADATADRGLGSVVLPRSVIRLCSKLVGALGAGLTLAIADSPAMLGCRERVMFVYLTVVGLMGISSSRDGNAAAACGTLTVGSSVRARHSSVRLRHMLSAFFRSCRSVTFPLPPIVLAPLEIGPGCPGAPIMEVRASASFAADSIASYTSGLTRALVLDRAANSMG